MWDVLVEKQDLNKVGTNAQSCVAATFLPSPRPIPAQAVLVQADVAALISCRYCVPVDTTTGQVGPEF